MNPRSELGEQASPDISIDDHDALVTREDDGHHRTIVAVGEMSRNHTTSRKFLDLGQIPSIVIDFKIHERVRTHICLVLGVEVWNGERYVHLVREDDARTSGDKKEVSVGLEDLTAVLEHPRRANCFLGVITYREADFSSEDVFAIGHPPSSIMNSSIIHLSEFDTAVARISHQIPSDRISHLAQEIEVSGRISGLDKNAVTRATSSRNDNRSQPQKASSAIVGDQIPLNQIRAQVRYKNKPSIRIQN